MRVTSTLHPAPRALALFAAGLALAALPALFSARLWPLWLAFVAAYTVVLGVDAVLCPRAADIEARIDVPQTLPMSASTPARVLLVGARNANLPVRLTLDLSEELEPAQSRTGVLSGEESATTVPLRPRRRGRASIERLWLRYPGPLGLVRRTARFPLEREVEVMPNLAFVQAAALKFSNPRETLAGLKIERFTGDGSEFESLREYQSGFDPRSIDWKASARHTRLLSRELRAERNHHVVLALDTGRSMAEPLEGTPRLDHAIHAALLLAYVSLRNGDRVSLFAFDERPRCFTEPRGGVHQLGGLVAQTGGLEYSEAETNYTLGLTHLMSRLRRRSLVVVLTDFADTVTAELMVENVLRLSRRHLVLFVSLRDPVLERLAERSPDSLEDVERAVVAQSLAEEREVVLRRLGRRGVQCIDTVPGAVGAGLLNRYLEIKRREMI